MKKLVILLLILSVCWFVQTTPSYAKIEGRSLPAASLNKASSDYMNRTLVNIGNVALWIWSDGMSANQPNGNSGLFYPRGSTPSTAVIYQDGFIFGGEVNDGVEPVIRVGGQAYSIGTVPGAILSKGVAENLDDSKNVDRLWRVRRDFAVATDDALRLDAAEIYSINAADVTPGQISQIRATYKADWIDWPAYKGAPFYDADGDGKYTPQFNADGSPKVYPQADEPGYADGDQVVWLVVNDLTESATTGLYGSPPVGVELQTTLWAYKRADAMGNIIFKQFRMIYKGRAETPANATIDNLYVCQWSDPDLGEAGDDFAACDTTLSLGYCYNASSVDATYSQAGYPPPAGGYDFFAGPLVDAPGETGIFGLKPVADKKNLGMTSFAFFAAGQEDSDPTQRNYNGTLQWWNLLRGYKPRPQHPEGTPWTNPQTGERTMYRVPGDPVAGTGWNDANPGDRRILLVSGPTGIAFGDTVETVVAVVGGMGADRLSSVSVLKFYDRFAQNAFDVLFDLPKAPPSPPLTATELDGEIFLNWGNDAAKVAEVENFNKKGYAFEGYNLYQLPNAGATPAQGIKLATYDVANEVTTVVQEDFDATSGMVLVKPVQIGKNSGIKRTYTIDRDYFRDMPLANGRTYYFAVTAYNYNPTPGLTTTSLESPPTVVTVIPQSLKPGVRISTVTGDTIKTVVHEGGSDGNVVVLVTDPTRVTGDAYKVIFNAPPGDDQTWTVINTTKGDTVLKNQLNQTGDENYLNVDGLTLVVTGAPLNFKDFLVVANANGPLDPPEYGALAWNASGFPHPTTADRPDGNRQTAGPGLWAIHTADNGSRASYAAFLSRVTRDGGNWGMIVPYDWEIRFTAAGGYGFEPNAFVTGDYFGGTAIKVPFEIWRVGDVRVNDTSDDVRCIPYIIDNQGDGIFNYAGDDHSISGADNDPFTDWIYIEVPDAGNPGDGDYKTWEAKILSNPAGYQYLEDCTEAMARLVFVNANGGSVSDPTFPANVNVALPETGMIFQMISTKPNTMSDVFTFTTSGYQPTVSKDNAMKDIEKINVFPNPYYGFNIVEKNPFSRFVTFNHLPAQATIRVFSLAGVLVRTVEKNDATQFATWDLLNESGLPVASGLYLIYIDMPELGKTKTLKLAVVREQQFLQIY